MKSLAFLLCAFTVGCGDAPRTPAAEVRSGPPPIVEGVGRTEARAATADGRDLEADERAGGHTLAKHVGRTDAQLRERLQRERGISAASTWSDRDTAARTIDATLGQARRRVARWTERSGGRPNLALDWRGRAVVGRSLERGAPAAIDVECAVVVLRWDTRRDDYFVLTSYPEVCR